MPKTTQAVPLAYSPQGVVEASSLSLRKVREDIAAGRLKSFKMGRRRIVLRADLEDYLRSATEAQ